MVQLTLPLQLSPLFSTTTCDTIDTVDTTEIVMDVMDTCSDGEGLRDLGEEDVLASPPPGQRVLILGGLIYSTASCYL